jgi:hypothetical protein
MTRYLKPDRVLRLADGATLTRLDIERDPTLLAAHSGERVLCCCTTAGVEMLIRHRQGRHFLANLPGRSHHHASTCPSFVPDPEIDPRRHYSGAALTRSADALHIVVSSEPLSSPPFPHLSPRAALECLWDEADLTLWSPRMRGKRSYPVVRSALQRAAERIVLRDAPLSNVLFFPDPAQGIPAPAHQFVAGRVVAVHASAYGVGFDFAHSRLGDLCWLAARDWTPDIDAVFGDVTKPSLPPNVEVWALGRLGLGASRHPQLWAPGFLTVTPEDRLPADDPAQCAMLRWLVEQGRRFRRCPLLDARADPSIPFVSLLDAGPPVYVFTPDRARVPPPLPRSAPPAPPSAPDFTAARTSLGAPTA